MNWYKYSQYDEKYQDRVNELSKKNPYPFSEWFDANGRVYIPFQTEQTGDQVDIDVQNLLSDNGCEITDYRGGYCQQGNRTLRIGKFLNQIQQIELQKLQQRYDQGEIYNLDREIQEMNNYFNDIKNQFMNSSYRSQKQQSQFQIVISQNPHDVATMSTGRNWTSCMNLEDGQHEKDVFCEVEKGGLVAYLINNNDLEIQKPLSRIHIRRFENSEGRSIAIPEESVYGDDVAGFSEVVKQWLDNIQGEVIPGIYKRQGGEYSDTFEEQILRSPKTKEGLIKWLHGEDKYALYSTWEVNDLLYNEFIENNEYYDFSNYGVDSGEPISNFNKIFNTKEEAEEYFNKVVQEDQEYGETDRETIEEVMQENSWEWVKKKKDENTYVEPRFSLQEIKHDNKNVMKKDAAEGILNAEKGEYSKDILLEVKDIAFGPLDYHGTLLKSFYSKYPELLNDDDIKKLKDQDHINVIKHLPEEQQKVYKQEYLNYVNSNLDDVNNLIDVRAQQLLDKQKMSSDINEKVRTQQSFSTYIINNIHNYILNPLKELFNPIPEPTVQKLINLQDKIYKNFNISLDEKHQNINSNIVDTLNITGSDTPTVQRFYQSLLPYWINSYYDDHSSINVSTLGVAIANLGKNGKQFIPFMKKKLKESQGYGEVSKKEQEGLMPGNYRWNQIEDQVKRNEKRIERFLYILDSLESGRGHSGKYKFYSSYNWYKKAKKYDDNRNEGEKLDTQLLCCGYPKNRRKNPYKPNKKGE